MSDTDFRGQGWRFPIRPDPGGALGYVGLDDNVEQSVELLLRTHAGERVMRPEFGTTARDLLFEADSEQHVFELERAIADTLRRWEPRVEVDTVRATPGDAERGEVEVTVVYRVLRTNTKRSVVFPFYLLSGEEAVEQ